MGSEPRAIIFDMDGTLTRSVLDFDRIREEIGLPHEPILEAIEKLPTKERLRAEQILRKHEAHATEMCELQENAVEVVAAIRASGLPAALMTRNSRQSVNDFLNKFGMKFDLIRTREDGAMKPSPEPVYAICQALNRRPQDTWVVGDFHFDIQCGSAAGATTVLFVDSHAPMPDWSDEADHVISQLTDLLSLLGLS
jgi:HAD superfamily hydrolase (TIGR01509 family)